MAIQFLRTQEEWDAWQRLTPQERFCKAAEFLRQYLAMGGSLEPDYDPQSPFNDDFYQNGPPGCEPHCIDVNHPQNARH
jgi:hypothetical protein